MKKTILLIVGMIFQLFVVHASLAQDAEEVTLRLNNTMQERVDYYLANPGQTPKSIGSVAAGSVKEIQSHPGDVLLFAINRKQFQKYVTKSNDVQKVTLNSATAPAGNSGGSNGKAASGALTKKPAPPPQSDDGMKWQYFAFNPADTNGSIAQLVYGIPETDAVQVVADCSATTYKGKVSILLSGDVNNRQPNSPVSVSVTGDGGYARKLNGTVRRDGSGEGLEGYRLILDYKSPLWNEWAQLASMKYGQTGKPSMDLKLNGFASLATKFLQACRNGGSSAAAPATTGGSQSNSCKTMKNAKSTNAGAEITLTFVNKTNEDRGVLWINGDGQPVDYGHLAPGQSMKIQTWTSHPWMFSDGPGNCIEMYLPKKGATTFEIKVPSPGFGDE